MFTCVLAGEFLELTSFNNPELVPLHLSEILMKALSEFDLK